MNGGSSPVPSWWRLGAQLAAPTDAMELIDMMGSYGSPR